MFVNITQVSLIDLKHEKYFQEQKQLDPIIPEQATHLSQSIVQRDDLRFPLNCEKQQFVSCTSNLLEQKYDFPKRTMFLQK